MRVLAPILALALPLAAVAETPEAVLDAVLSDHVLPRAIALEETTAALVSTVASGDCAPSSEALRASYQDAFDAWIAFSHLRFGPASTDERVFALSFWPDSRGVTPRSLTELIETEDPVVETAEGFAEVSVAARGFYAMEFLLYDETVSGLADSPYGCTLIARVAADINRTSDAIATEWHEEMAPAMRDADAADGLRMLYAALSEGLQFNVDLRLGRPMGTFDRPRPRRAEAWRSGRSLRNLTVSVENLRSLALLLAQIDGVDEVAIAEQFDLALNRIETLDDPLFAGVATPQGRIAVEALQSRIREAAMTAQAELAPALGVTLTFNSLDGD